MKVERNGGSEEERGKKGDALRLCRVTRGLVAALIGSPRDSSQFFIQIRDRFLYRSSLLRHLRVLGFICGEGEVRRRDTPSTFESRSEKAWIGMIKVLPRFQPLYIGV